MPDLTKKGRPNHVDWQILKDMLIRSPMLRLLDIDRPFILQTNASDSGVGAPLLKRFEHVLFPIAYASKKLLTRENIYSVIERECLAMLCGTRKVQNICILESLYYK